jgi:thioredoxin 1
MLALAGQLIAAGEDIYDQNADARREIAAATAVASRSGTPARNIVLVFGANWCADSRALDVNMHRLELASLLKKEFVVVKIDVGRFDKNLTVAEQYGVPIKKGIPALAVLGPHGKVLYAMDQGQFANARHMSHESIKAFFEKWAPSGRSAR